MDNKWHKMKSALSIYLLASVIVYILICIDVHSMWVYLKYLIWPFITILLSIMITFPVTRKHQDEIEKLKQQHATEVRFYPL